MLSAFEVLKIIGADPAVPMRTFDAATTLGTRLTFAYIHRMRKSLFLLTVTVAFAVLAIAQISDDEYKTEMQSLGANVTAVRNAADNAAAAPAAKSLVETFTKVAAYWKAKNAQDAVTFAEDARDAAKAIEDGKGDKAANLMKLQQQCGACHMAHRGGGRGNFTIK